MKSICRHPYSILITLIIVHISVYSRVTGNHDDAKKHIQRLQNNMPKKGSVRALIVTEKQYTSMYVLVGEKTASEDLLKPRNIIEL